VPTLSVYEIEPVALLKREVSTIYDFGTEQVGTLKICVRGKEGDIIELRAAEELVSEPGMCVEGNLTPETQIRYNTRANCSYSEKVIMADGENLIEQYDYKAFRYAEIVCSDDIEILSFRVVARHYPFDDNACVLDTSDTVLSRVFEICKSGVKLGSQEVYVDCPGREKGQYAGDLTVTSASQLWLTGDTTLFCKAVRNQMESAFIDEGLMAVTPGSFMQEIADYSLQFPVLALRYYDFTGDREGLLEMLGVCDRMLTYFEKYQREDGLLDGVTCKWNLVDWPQNLRDNYDFELTKPIGKGVHNVINAFYIGAVICTEKIIDILGIELEEGAKRSEALIKAFNNCFWRPELGLYADSETSSHASLHSNVLPLYFGFAKAESHANIADLIRRKGFSSGVYMAYFTLKALARIGLYSDVYNMITSTGENSWYNMVLEGGTTCFEAWGKDKKWNTSLCHPWASGPISVLIEDIIGISPKKPGFEEVDIRPHIPAGVEKLNMRIPLVNGKHIEFEWERGFYNYRILK
jgi:alpha-L-rhamnosidase